MRYLPAEIGQAVAALGEERQGRLEELRMRRGCEVTAVWGGREAPLSLQRPLVCTAATLRFLVNAATGYSAYAANEALRQGFLPLEGGHRLGLCGTAVVEDGRVTALKDISSASLRLARQWKGCADRALALLGPAPESTLIAGPPGSGKTTLLRELVRLLSDRLGFRVGLVDSRGELAACFGGEPQLAVGRRTDVVSLIPKEAGMELLLRSMRPAYLALDEITAAGDVEAMVRAGYCGVRLLATAHAFGPEELRSRPLYRRLLETGCFQNFLFLDERKEVRLERMKAPC